MKPEEIRKIFKDNGISGYRLSKDLNVSQVGADKFLNGETKKPYKSTLLMYEEYIQNGFKTNKTYAEENVSGNIEINEPFSRFNTKAGSNYEELQNGKYLLTVPLIPVKAHATYISEYMDEEFYSELRPVTFIVDRVGQGSYKAFEIQNDSMNDGSINSIPDGAIVLGRELGKQHWRSQLNTNGYPYWIIVHKETILCKEIIKHEVSRGVITCHSLNGSPEYRDFELRLDDCHQLFNIIKKQI